MVTVCTRRGLNFTQLKYVTVERLKTYMAKRSIRIFLIFNLEFKMRIKKKLMLKSIVSILLDHMGSSIFNIKDYAFFVYKVCH